MIIIFLVLSFLHTLQGAPIPASTSAIAINLETRDDCSIASNATAMATRTTYELVRSCLLTVFACVWKSVHPNIPGPLDSGWTRLKRRLTTTLCVLVAPELMAMLALRQYLGAKEIADDYNVTILNLEEKGTLPLWGRTRNMLKEALQNFLFELPAERAMRPVGQKWTMTHGFFIQMGGFLLYENDKPMEVLKYERMKELIEKGEIDTPIYTETDLQDRSKGDIISKGLVALQTTWFAVQCITRLCSHLPLSELEVVTLGFAALNVIIYAIWWKKPQGVGATIFIPRKPTGEIAEHAVDDKKSSEEAEIPHEKKATEVDNTTSLTLKTATEGLYKSTEGTSTAESSDTGHTKKSWLRQALEEARKNQRHWALFMIVIAPRIFAYSLLRPLLKMGGDLANTREVPLRVPMFYANKRKEGHPFARNATCGIGVLFGLVHVFGWWSEALSPTQLLLWRISTLVIITAPVVLALALTLVYPLKTPSDQTIAFVASIITASAYLAARLTLITLAFIALHVQLPNVFKMISWTSYIPHV